MRILPLQPQSIKEALTTLRAGGIVIHATETCYGIACDLANPDAVRKLFAIKKRPEYQPVSALFSSMDHASSFVDINQRALELAKKYLPGPLTIVLPLGKDISSPIYVCPPPYNLPPITSPLPPTIGVRISSHPLAAELARRFGKPMATTSANLHGEPNPYSMNDILAAFGSTNAQPDLILDSGTLPLAPPSTVVEMIGATLTILRQGELQINEGDL